MKPFGIDFFESVTPTEIHGSRRNQATTEISYWFNPVAQEFDLDEMPDSPF